MLSAWGVRDGKRTQTFFCEIKSIMRRESWGSRYFMNVVVRSYVPVHVALSVRASTCAILDVKVEVVSKKKRRGKKQQKSQSLQKSGKTKRAFVL